MRAAGYVIFAAVTATIAAPASAQSIEGLRDLLRGAVRSTSFGDLVQGVTGFAALPGVSTANFTVDGGVGISDADVSKVNLPLSHQFTQAGVLGGTLYTELTLGYLSAEQSFRDVLTGTLLASDVDTDTQAFSAIGGIGLTFPITKRTSIRPLALLGYSRLEEDSDFSGTGGALLDSLTDGFLFNFTANEVLYGAALEIDHARSLGGDVNLTGNARYNHLFADTFDASDPVLETSSDFGVFTALAEFDGPTGATALNRELRWIAFAANSTFPGRAADALGFDYFFEFGGGVEIVDRTVVSGVEGLSLRASAIVGDDVTGWSVAVRLEF